ncbi:hypothetical protein [Aeribacillus pallidus]|uniref:hypothetical protein n=1 Tax=Aeribacillus pallidus TaxID=33936 RepID=UPI003D246D39
MKRWFLFSVIIFSLFYPLQGIHAGEYENAEIIQVYKEDVTGDGKKDKITLKGIRFEPNAAFWKVVWAEIDSATGQTFRIKYEPGYDPEIQFVDLIHNGVPQLFESSATGGSGGFYTYNLSSLKQEKQQEISLPTLVVEGSFQDNYRAVITILATKESYHLNLTDRKKDYDRLGLYYNGKLNEPTELMIPPIAYFQVVQSIDGKEGPGLRGYQQISGAYHADAIGTVQSTWYYENNEWQLLDVTFNSYEKKKN